MTQHTRNAEKALIGAFILLSSTLISVVVHYQQVATEHIHATTPLLLQEAVKENAKNKTINISLEGFAYTPGKIGSTIVRTFQTADTTFTYPYKITDMETEILDSRQSFLLLADNLHSHDIKVILDSLLQQNNINSQTTVGISASFCKKFNDWSSPIDTANTHLSYQTCLVKQGLWGDINYRAHISYTFAALWRLMPQTLILVLLLLEILSFCLCIGYIIKRRYNQGRQTLLIEKEQTIPYQKTTVEANALSTAIKDIKLKGQNADLLQMFIESNGRVNKETIKKRFWSTSENPTTNMTTLVDRLKKKLAEAESSYIIITDPEDDRFYLLHTESVVKASVKKE